MRAAVAAMVASMSVLVLSGCAESDPGPRTVQGECADAHGTSVCTWATLDDTDRVIAFGATVPLASIEGAPHDWEMAWPPLASAIVGMPAEVIAATGIDHLTMYWEPHGHPPGAYLTPHFDFHFYNVSADTRMAIDCADHTKPTALPADYRMVDIEIPELGMLTGLCVPEMGMHALLASELESEDIFDGTMVLGYYQGAPIFFEPMIARDLLVRRQSFDLSMPVVSGLPEGVRYPERFRAEYDEATDAYRFTFSGI